MPLLEERDFTFSPEDFAERLGPKTKVAILNSPQNPTGGALSTEDVASAAALIAETDAWVLSDEIYSQLLYDGEFASIASHPGMLERTILLDGLSKTYAMTGWRCGLAAVPDELVDPLTRFFVNSTSCVPGFVQLAGVAALRGPQDEPRAMVEEFRARRSLVVEGLNRLPGVTCRMPKGASTPSPTSRACRSPPTSSPHASSRTWASRCSREAPSAPSARTACASATRTRARTSPPRSNAWTLS